MEGATEDNVARVLTEVNRVSKDRLQRAKVQVDLVGSEEDEATMDMAME